ncbi:MAG: L,D-transpeptidase family protein [Candidatus Omnitrophica bacterium]|nr:L,D-transpeptidase family protein [Candidatus Omnitrophota bacterium]
MRKKLVVITGIIIIVIFGVMLIFHTAGKNLFLSKQESEEIAVGWSEILNQAAEQEVKGDPLRAKSLYEKLVNDFANSPQVGDWQKKIWDLNIKLLFSPTITEGSILYEIEPGDSLSKIAKKFNTTIGLLKRSNGLLSEKIISGRKLKAWTKPFNIVVDKSQNILILKSNDEVIKTYIVSTGINNSTPIGNFKIVKKLVDPPWHTSGTVIPPESPDNILGSRWMGFDLEGYGIHGTINNETLGQQITQGCIRMSNSDVEELFTIVPRNTAVVIVD